ncbi:(d)CMP kinase [Bacteroidota bacterium]
MNTTRKLKIAIDGHSSSGKSSFAKKIAEMLNYVYIDSGAMYRSIAYALIKRNGFDKTKIKKDILKEILNNIRIEFRKNPKTNESETYLNGENIESKIRGYEVSEKVSIVSKLNEVREKMVEFQRDMARDKGVVMDGRDIGTVVFPDADIKIYMDADKNTRAQRRYDELVMKGEKVDFERILENIEKRDELDLKREISPLKKASDAYVLDNSNMNLDEEMEWFESIYKQKFG